MIRRFGAAATADAHREARYICAHWLRHHDHTAEFLSTLDRNHIDPHTPLLQEIPIVQAASYVQIVALTRLLASPHWKRLPLGSRLQVRTFTDELHATVNATFDWTARAVGRHPDPLAAMFFTQAANAPTPTNLTWPSSWPKPVDNFSPSTP